MNESNWNAGFLFNAPHLHRGCEREGELVFVRTQCGLMLLERLEEVNQQVLTILSKVFAVPLPRTPCADSAWACGSRTNAGAALSPLWGSRSRKPAGSENQQGRMYP